jgi:hypothetical protein
MPTSTEIWVVYGPLWPKEGGHFPRAEMRAMVREGCVRDCDRVVDPEGNRYRMERDMKHRRLTLVREETPPCLATANST